MLSSQVNAFITSKLVHSIHTSERLSFRGCRRRWDWIFRDGYYPLVTPKPLEFGQAFHKGMETFYNPATWHNKEAAKALALVTFKQTCDEQHKAFLKKNHGNIDPGVKADYDERIKLGLDMLKYYTTYISPTYDKGLKPLKVEIAFEVPIRSPEGDYVWCGCDRCWERWKTSEQGTRHYNDLRDEVARTGGRSLLKPEDTYRRYHWQGLPVTYGGRIDALIEDELGRYWIFDWKHLKITEPVLTPTGWVPIGDLRDGDLVIGRNGKPVQIIGVSPITNQHVWQVEWTDGTIVECSGSHRWTVYDRDNKLVTLTTKELSEAPSYQSYATPTNDAVEFAHSMPKPMHPYVLGMLLGDGHFKRQLSFASKTGETVEWLREFQGVDVHIEDQRHFGNSKWVIKGPWQDQLRDLELWGKLSAEKFIPQNYMFASVEDRLALLRGLYDTDGLRSTLRFCTISKQLAEDTANLVRSLGGKASISSSRERMHSNDTTHNATEYFVNFWLKDFSCHKWQTTPSTKRGVHRRPIASVRKTHRSAEMRCIAVAAEDNLYITRDYIVTHNTAARLAGLPSETSSYTDDEFMILDDQITSYCWALWTLDIPVAGFIYAQIKKAIPEEPEPNKHQRLGRWYSISKQLNTSYEVYKQTVEENDPQAYAAGLYNDFLDYLKGPDGPKYHVRHQVFRNEVELQNAGYYIWLEACDMLDPNLRIYPSHGRFTCTYCAFKDPCIGKNRGEDYQYTLGSMFEKRVRHYWEKLPSTESRGGE